MLSQVAPVPRVDVADVRTKDLRNAFREVHSVVTHAINVRDLVKVRTALAEHPPRTGPTDRSGLVQCGHVRKGRADN